MFPFSNDKVSLICHHKGKHEFHNYLSHKRTFYKAQLHDLFDHPICELCFYDFRSRRFGRSETPLVFSSYEY
jgi:hypothetical protein